MLKPDAVDRLGKLIPLLGSDKDGEVLSAARAISRTLAANGADLHDLARAAVGSNSGWIPSGRRAAPTTGAFNYANAYRESEPLFEGPEHPEALTRKFGLPIYAPDIVEPWPAVAAHCLRLNRSIPKKHGGKFLEDWHIKLLRTLIDDLRQPTNRHVEWIERVVARLHQARDAAHRKEAARG